MKLNLNLIFITLSLLFVGCAKVEEQKPNIILINIDDMGWRDIGFMGSEYYETPNIDALAGQGIIFDNAYAGAANCAPSRACIMSGQSTPRHGIYTVGTSERGKSKNRKLIPTKNNTVLPDSQYILTEALKDAGYTTCHAGKWHLNDDPTTQGFDLNIGGCEAGNPGSYYPPYKRVPLDAPSEDYYLTNLVMDKVLDFVKSNREKTDPFFLYYSPYAVHTPIQPVKSLLPKYEDKASWNGQDNAEYATMVENLDTQIGRLIAELKSSGKFDNTFILFTTDNGGVYKVTKQRPLRAGKGAYYEGGIKTPMFIYWPGKVEGEAHSEELVSHLDIYPTLLDVAGVDKSTDKLLDGNSIMPIISGEASFSDRALYWHFPIYLEGGYAECQDPIFRTRPGSAIRLGDWKLIQYFENNDLELYNVTNDISEKKNLIEKFPAKAEELLNKLNEWRTKVGAPVPTTLNPEYVENI